MEGWPGGEGSAPGLGVAGGLTSVTGRPGEALKDIWAVDLDKGGAAIPYHLEDPALRREYEETLSREGMASRMEPRFYEPGGAGAADKIGGF